MKWYWKLMVLIAAGTLLFVIVGMIYVVHAKYKMNDYVVQLGAAFNAATIVNAEETYTDEANAVIAQYQDQRAVIVPENYKALQSYLRRDYAMPPFSRVSKEKALHISFCGHSHLYIEPDRDAQGATLHFESGDETFRMHVTGSDLWERILELCISGRNKYPNLPLN